MSLMKVLFPVSMISWKMTQSAFRFCNVSVTIDHMDMMNTYKHQRRGVRMQRNPPIHRLETPIWLHPCRMSKVSCRQASSNLFRFVWAPDSHDLHISRQALLDIDPKPLNVSLELISNADCPAHALEIQKIISTPFRILLSLCDERLIHIEQREVVALLYSELVPCGLHTLLLAFVTEPDVSLQTRHGGNGQHLAQAVERWCLEKDFRHHGLDGQFGHTMTKGLRQPCIIVQCAQ